MIDPMLLKTLVSYLVFMEWVAEQLERFMSGRASGTNANRMKMITLRPEKNPDALPCEGASDVQKLASHEHQNSSTKRNNSQEEIKAKGKILVKTPLVFDDAQALQNTAKLIMARNAVKPSPKATFRPLPSLEILQRYVDVDPAIGLPINLIKRPKLAVGDVCGTTNTPYVIVYIKGVAWRWHRIAFKLYHGRDPVGLIDHVDGNPRNNKKSNIIEASYLENAQNRHVIKSNSGVLGVSKEAATGHWLASISSCGHNINLGRYRAKECAAAARKHAENILFVKVGA